MLAFGFWFGIVASIAGLAYFLFAWLPQHHLI